MSEPRLKVWGQERVELEVPRKVSKPPRKVPTADELQAKVMSIQATIAATPLRDKEKRAELGAQLRTAKLQRKKFEEENL